MKTILVSLTVALAMIAGSYAQTAQEIGVATATELDRIQTLRKIEHDIPLAELALQEAEQAVRADQEEAAGPQRPIPELKQITDPKLRAQMIAFRESSDKSIRETHTRAVDMARERLQTLRAEAARLAAK